ncbi:helix-hairpin-helix domain-containing protein [Monashia sp. NPDC004114]
MPFRRLRPPTDLERVARILRDHPVGSVAGEAAAVARPGSDIGGPVAPGRDGAPDGGAADDGDSDPAWVADLPEGPRAALAGRLSRAIDETGPRSDDATRLDAALRRARRPAFLTVPDSVRDGRRSLSSTAIVALVALAVAVGCAFVLRVLWAERSVGPAVAPGGTGSVVVGGTPVGAAAGSSALGPTSDDIRATDRFAVSASAQPSSSGLPSAGPAGEVVVDVVGRVARPGLVRLRQGARVADAITSAGGASRGADLGALNLARLLVDGEQVRVPKVGDASVAATGSAPGGSSPGPGAAGTADAPAVSLNSADLASLDSLPGVGPVLAQRILDWRAAHGRFTSIDELGEVSGIGDKLMARLRPRVTL